jgi:hypothetical protein
MRFRTLRLLAVCAAFAVAAAAHAAPAGAAVVPSLDTSHAATATVGAAGGTLSTTTADGAGIDLVIPRNALVANEQVRMTPLAELVGGGVKLIAGVQLEPDGLRLLKPAKLEIHPGHPVPRSRQVAFGYRASGSQFGLVPLAGGATITIPVLAFGGVGLAAATPGQLRARERSHPSDLTAALLQQLAGPSYAVRNHVSLASSQRALRSALGGFFGRFIKPTLRHAGSSYRAWTRAATRGVLWLREGQVLKLSRSFRSQRGHLRTTVFNRALHKRWNAAASGCQAGHQTLRHLQKALLLGRAAEVLGTASHLGGASTIDGVLQSCAQLPLQVMAATQVNWQATLMSERISQDTVLMQTAATPLALQHAADTNHFSFASGRAPIIERITTYALSPMSQGQGCSDAAFISFSSDPNQMYAAFTASLTVPADLFSGAAAPAPTAKVTVSGADGANWAMSCPSGEVFFSQPPGAMAGLGAVSALTAIPVSLSTRNSSRTFDGSAEILDGSTIVGFADAKGSITVTVPR